MEEGNNQGAPAALDTSNSADNASSTTQQPDAAAALDGANSTAQKTPDSGVPAFDPRTSYEALNKQLAEVNKNYGALRSEYTRRTQYEAELKKQIETLHKAFADATRQEISPEEFMKTLQTQGVKAFDPLREQWTKELNDNHSKALQERDSQISKMATQIAVMARKSDTKNYPDFENLMPTMAQIADAPNCPVDWTQDPDVIYDTLYKLARDLKSEESIKQAKEIGRKEAESLAAKEANSAVAAGGKTNTAGLDTRNMSAAQLRQHFTKLGMVSD